LDEEMTVDEGGGEGGGEKASGDEERVCVEKE
jgi:hypothetical protein